MDILWIFIKTFRKNVLNPEFGSCAQGEMDKHDPDVYQKGPPWWVGHRDMPNPQQICEIRLAACEVGFACEVFSAKM